MNPKTSSSDHLRPSDSAASNPVLFGWDVSAVTFRRGIVCLILVGLVVRLAYFVEHAGSPSFGVPALDEKYYDTVAKMLLAGDDLHTLHAFRPLLYPLFLAGWYQLGGAWGVDLALLVQHLLGVATAVLVALIGRRLFCHRASGLAGGFLYLMVPMPLCFEGDLLIEPSYVFLIFLALWLHLRAAESTGRRAGGWWFICGALVALASQERANILIFLAIYPLFAAWRWWRARTGSTLMPLFGVAGAVAMMVPWGFLNLKQADEFHLVTNAGGVNFYLGNRQGANGMFGMDVVTALSNLSRTNPAALANYTSSRYEDLVEVWARAEYAAAVQARGQVPAADPKAISEFWMSRALDEIKADPSGWLKVLAKKTWLMTWNREVPNNKDFAFLQQEFFWLRILPVRWVVLFALAPVGVWVAWRFRNRDGLFLLVGYIALYSAGNIAFFICDRYRYPILPAMAVLAGGGLCVIWELSRRRDWRALRNVLFCLAVMAGISLPNWFGAKLPNFSQDYYFRSCAWYEKGRFVEALADVDRSLALNPENAGAMGHRGNVLLALHRLAEARDAFQRALQFIPGNSSLWNNLGATLEAANDYDGAIQAFEQALACSPPSRSAFWGLACMQIRTGKLAAATATLDRLDQLEAHSAKEPETLAIRAAVARQLGQTAAADALEKQAMAADPDVLRWIQQRIGLLPPPANR